MSTIIQVETENEVLPYTLSSQLRNDGYKFSFFTAGSKLGCFAADQSVATLWLEKIASGYQLALPIIASKADLELSRDLLKHVQHLTGGVVYSTPGKRIDELDSFFSESYINNQLDEGLKQVLAEVEKSGLVSLDAPYRKFWVGKRLLASLLARGKDYEAMRSNLFDLIRKSQYEKRNAANTPLYHVGEEQGGVARKTLTAYANGCDYDYLIAADYVSLMNDDEELLTLTYANFQAVAPTSWELVDELQYKLHVLSPSEWQQLWTKALPYNVEPA